MNLNLPQRIVLAVAALAIVTMILFPPSCYYTYMGGDQIRKVFSGYQFIGKLESNTTSKIQIPALINRDERVSASIYYIETTRLSFQLIGILLTTGLLVIAFHRQPYYKP